MSGNWLLDGAILSISLFNTITLLWLAFTVLLNAQRRTWVCPHALPGRWLVESSTHDAGRVWRWWCEQLLGERDGAETPTGG